MAFLKSIILCSVICTTLAWDSEDLKIFDLVEDIGSNFYEFLGVTQNATSTEIKRAFRSLSIVLHPDKNPAENANKQFRNLVSIYETLKDPSKREKYNKVLRDGLPNWKSALYYYRRMRKIGLYEGVLIVFIIGTIGQYLFIWAAYLEKKYTAQQIIGAKLKKMQKKNKTIYMDTMFNEIPVPSVLNTLPFQIALAIYNLPKMAKGVFDRANEVKQLTLEKRRLEIETSKRQGELERLAKQQMHLRKEKKENLRKRKHNAKAPEKTEEELLGYSKIHSRQLLENEAIRPASQQSQTLSGGFWSDEDIVELVSLVNKYPAGSFKRWNTIAEAMNRTVQEITFMAAKLKGNGYRVPGGENCMAENITQENKVKGKKETLKNSNSKNLLILKANWSQEQQRALESAIVKHPKNTTACGSDRWEKIANCVPGKTKEECLRRYKYLYDLLKSQTTQRPEQQQVHQQDQALEENHVEKQVKGGLENGKRLKRKQRRNRRDLSSDKESDDIYQYKLS